MNSDDYGRNSHYSAGRKPLQSKSQGYSPSSNYNYGNSNMHNNGSSHGNHTSGLNKQYHRKPGGSFKRDNNNSSDKLIKQNDLIISLLKEIRDRLPAPPTMEKKGEDLKMIIDDKELFAPGDEHTDSSEVEDTEEQFDDDYDATDDSQDQNDTEILSHSNDDELDQEVNGNQ